LHPAIDLIGGGKKERYKCFLEGEYKRKKIIILPSFFDVNEGINIYDFMERSEMVWKFNLKKFIVMVVGENLETFDFGKLSRLRNAVNLNRY
jgi:metallophosphoesterase superfamily enzyme